MIIWDEDKYGEEIFNDSQVKTTKWQYKELKCVIKYMLDNNFAPKDIRAKLNKCCQDDIKYLKDKHKLIIFNKLIQQSKKGELIKKKRIKIYKSEIEIIKSLQDINLEKTLFILLVYSKWLNDMEWFALMRSDIAAEAKLQKLNSANRQKLLTTLCQSGFVKSDVKKIGKGRSDDKKHMRSIPFLQTSGEIAFEFDNYINVVYRYVNHVYGGYFECVQCGGMFEKTNNRHTLCSKCAKYVPVKTKKINCIDCGRMVEVAGIVKNKKRCDDCQKKADRIANRERVRKSRLKNKQM